MLRRHMATKKKDIPQGVGDVEEPEEVDDLDGAVDSSMRTRK